MTINERVSAERLNAIKAYPLHALFNMTTAELENIISELQQYRAAAEKPIGSFHIIDQQVDGTTDYVKDGEWPIDNGELLVYAAPQVTSVPVVTLPSTRLWAGVTECYEKSDVIAAIRAAGAEVSNDD
ncbi:hypothetical protein [Atlantibacter hermannii]|uniref:hypothetical protein n=1 Tax=Atlantibacter hermannii TaxID=565 RepID=UPI0028A66BC0|nr:hypothetical protein [Atlantibacter hermannii]